MFFIKESPESPRMFDNNILDGLSRTHWSIVPLLYVPATAFLLWYGLTRAQVSVLASIGLAAGGLLTWTFVEYWLHRTLFHWIPQTSWGERMHFFLHGVHHDWPHDKYRLVMPPAVSLLLFFVSCCCGRPFWAGTAGLFTPVSCSDICAMISSIITSIIDAPDSAGCSDSRSTTSATTSSMITPSGATACPRGCGTWCSTPMRSPSPRPSVPASPNLWAPDGGWARRRGNSPWVGNF